MERRNVSPSQYDHIFRSLVNVVCDRIKFDGLPEEIDDAYLRYQLLLYGKVLFFTHKNSYHVFWYSGTGKHNEYHIDNEFLVTNPWMDYPKSFSKTFNESQACIIYSDINAYIEDVDCGLFDFVTEYAKIISAIDHSIYILAKNSRLIAILTGQSVSFVESAKIAIDRVFKGDDSFAIMEESLLDSIKVNPIGEKSDYKISELIKARQYYISEFYQKIGVSCNQNMKKERLTDDESELISAVSAISFNHIINNINTSLKKVNKTFNLNITCSINNPEQNESSRLDQKDSAQDQKDSAQDPKDSAQDPKDSAQDPKDPAPEAIRPEIKEPEEE